MHFGVRRDAVRDAARAFLAAETATSPAPPMPHLLDRRMLRPLHDLTAAVTPLHAVLFAAIAQLPDGMEFILQMRADLLVRKKREGWGRAGGRAGGWLRWRSP